MKLITFPNLGNTCYVNSVIQCFIYNNVFRKFCDIPELKKIILESDIIKNNENLNVTYNLSIFVNFLFNKKTQFKRFEQNDAHEFLVQFLDILTSEVHGRMDFHKTKNKFWNEFLKQNNFSPFINEYFGQSKNCVTCQGCRKSNDSFDQFSSINLVVPPKETKSVSQLFVKYLSNILEADPSNLYHCDTCKSLQISQHKCSLVILPKTLIIVLKRYSSSGTKIKSEVILDKSLHIKEDTVKVYNLTAVVNHQGNLFDGHYTANVLINDSWYLFDDEIITKVNVFNYANPNAYILFYTNQN
jgi:ubiquitin carboxyl-terminal hydrolase 2/21